MGGLVKSIFGGKDKSAQREQIKANAGDRQLFEKLATESQANAKALMGSADTNRNMALQQSLNLLGGTIPTRLDAFQQGNVGAQKQIIGGLPLIQQAVMGMPLDMSALNPVSVNYNTDYAQQTLPQFQSSADALKPPEQPKQPDLSSILRMAYGGMNGY